VWLIPRALESVFYDLCVKTEVSLTIPRRISVLLTLSVSRAAVWLFIGFAAASFPVVLLGA
jgi:hypothetical protein